MGAPDHEWKKGSAELLALSILEDQPRHGYDISKLIQVRSGGALRFHVTSLYPLLYRLEARGLVAGRWVEKAEQRRRRYYSLTPQGRKVLLAQRKSWVFCGRSTIIPAIRFAVRNSLSCCSTTIL